MKRSSKSAAGVTTSHDSDALAMGAGMAPVDKEPKADTRTQAQKFEDTAREHGADDTDDDRLKGVLRKMAKPKG